MFGYLNLNDPTKIQANESQEAHNVRLDRGYLELINEFVVDESINRRLKDINGHEIFISADSGVIPANNTYQPLGLRGYLKRNINGVIDLVGMPRMDSAGTPATVAAVAYGSQPYPAGEYTYVITAYDPVTQEESAAWIYEGVSVGANEVAQFSSFPGYNSNPLFANKTSAEWRIYRRPIGGSEFLRVLPSTTLAAFTPLAGPIQDITPDEDLGAANTTYPRESFSPDYYNKDRLFSVIAVHNNRLWFKQDEVPADPAGPENAGSVILYSEVNKFGEVGESSYFGFSSEVVALHSINESLVVLCKENVYVIYGDDDNDFVVKQVTDSNIGAVGGFSSAVVGNTLFFLGSNKDDRNKADGLYALCGSQLERVSSVVDSLFPANPIGTLDDIIFGAGQVRNRFFVVRCQIDDPDESSTQSQLVFDTATRGFLTSSYVGGGVLPTSFIYKSKEFGSPGKWDNMRRAFVRGIGQFTVELYYDFEKVDEIEFNISGSVPDTEDFTVPPYRGNYFSFRFVGQADAKIYEFGRLE